MLKYHCYRACKAGLTFDLGHSSEPDLSPDPKMLGLPRCPAASAISHLSDHSDTLYTLGVSQWHQPVVLSTGWSDEPVK